MMSLSLILDMNVQVVEPVGVSQGRKKEQMTTGSGMIIFFNT